MVTNGGSGDGFAIQWQTANSSTPNPLAPGASLVFSFDSTATPATMAGDSPFYTSTPIGTSFVYTGAPFSGGSDEFVATVAPEPSSFVLVLLGGAGLGAILVRRKVEGFLSGAI